MRFLGMAGYYRKFCRDFATLCEPLTNLLRKDVAFTWSDACQRAFDRVKMLLMSAPVLVMPDFGKPFILTTDASDCCVVTGRYKRGRPPYWILFSQVEYKSEELFNEREGSSGFSNGTTTF